MLYYDRDGEDPTFGEVQSCRALGCILNKDSYLTTSIDLAVVGERWQHKAQHPGLVKWMERM